jgi:trans-2,3-dihydro-3-hydroxyanthranilate isomerase
MRLSYRIVNVFTQNRGKLTGNPLCVFEDARGLDDVQMQALALQFNLSETTFIFPSNKAHARVRIFAPSYEMQFAGHPTLGTASVVDSLQQCGGKVQLELNVGVIPVEAQGNQWELQAKAATSRAPRASQAELAKALGLQASDVGAQPLWVNTGSEQLIVPLTSADAVRRVSVSYDALLQVTADGPRPQAYVFADTGNDTLLSRFFFTKTGSVIEDPATGSATANLGGWHLANSPSLPIIKIISQGELAGRPSTLRLRIDSARSIFVAGEVVELGGGYIEL